MTRPRPAALVAPLLLLALVACGSDRSPTPSPASPTASVAPGSAHPSSGGASPGAAGGSGAGSGRETGVWLPDHPGAKVPAEVVSRRPLPFCGVEKAPAPQPGEFIDRSVRLCFWNAYLAGTEAEFVSVQTTIEGAPIATIYRLSSDGTSRF